MRGRCLGDFRGGHLFCKPEELDLRKILSPFNQPGSYMKPVPSAQGPRTSWLCLDTESNKGFYKRPHLDSATRFQCTARLPSKAGPPRVTQGKMNKKWVNIWTELESWILNDLVLSGFYFILLPSLFICDRTCSEGHIGVCVSQA